MNAQSGILDSVPPLARYLTFSLRDEAKVKKAIGALSGLCDGRSTVVGLGRSTVAALGGEIEGLRPFPEHSATGIDVPSTPAALWCWLRGDDRGDLLHRSRAIRSALAPAFDLEDVTDAFQYGESRDLTGFEDGTENPTGDEAVEVAIVSGQGKGFDGSSFVAVQRWIHDLDRFEAMAPADQDDVIGRHRADNEEFDEAPPSAHVKRTAQESFEPEAFVVRRSMPWAEGFVAGLVFVAFGRSLGAFEVLLHRMVGAEDGIMDGLFRFTRPVTGSTFWCPPMHDGRLDLRALRK